MDKFEYISRLKKKLNTLPPEELDSAISYYEEYFDEAGPSNEQKAIEELGTPEKAASMIKAEHAVRDMEKPDVSAKKGIQAIFIVILAIFASPIAIPIAIAIFAVIAALVITLASVFFALLIVGAAVAAGGFVPLIASVFVIIASPATFIFFFGFGLALIAFGAAMLVCIVYISKICFVAIANMASRLVLGRGNK